MNLTQTHMTSLVKEILRILEEENIEVEVSYYEDIWNISHKNIDIGVAINDDILFGNNIYKADEKELGVLADIMRAIHLAVDTLKIKEKDNGKS
jgi:hypothetical protein